MTAFDVLSSEMYIDFPAIVSALNDVSIPNVLAHVPHDAFQAMWGIVEEHVMTGGTPESYFEMLKRNGKSSAEIQTVRHRHDVHWEDAVALIQDGGGVEPYIHTAIRRSLDRMPRLWAQPACNHARDTS